MWVLTKPSKIILIVHPYNIEDRNFGLCLRFKVCMGVHHRWELLVNYPVLVVLMIIYHYVEIIWRVLVTPNILYNIYNHEKCYTGEPFNIHIQPLINIILDNNWGIATKKGKGKLPLFCGDGERIILIYGTRYLKGFIGDNKSKCNWIKYCTQTW